MITVAAYGMQAVTAQESNPCIDLEKVAPDEAYRGETITIDYSVFNCGDTVLTDVRVVDAVSGMQEFLGTPLGVGEYWNFSDEYTIPEDWPYPKMCSIAIAYGWSGDVQVEDWDCECIVMKTGQPPNPEVLVDKMAVGSDGSYVAIDEANVGQVIYWYIYVENTGNVDLDTYINDTDLGLAFNWHDNLVTGTFVEFWLPYTVDFADVVDNFIEDTVFVEAWYETTLLDESASDAIFVGQPSIEVFKTGPMLSAPGHEIIFEISVHNNGNVPLDFVEMYDNAYSNGLYIAGVYASTTDLLPDEWWYVTVTMMVPEEWDCSDSDFGDWLYNYVDVYATYDLYVWDEWDVFIACPSMEVTKTGPDFSAPGHVIEWEIAVENTGNVPLMSVDIEDPLTGDYWYDVFIDVGQTWSTVVEYMVPEDWCVECGECTHVINVVFVTADVFGDEHCILMDDAESAVFIHCPSVEVFKTGPMETAPGHEVTFEISVHNNGNIPLDTVYIYDWARASISGLYVGEAWVVIEDLEPCEWYNFSVTYMVPEIWDCSIDGDWLWNDVWVDADVYGDEHCWVSDHTIWDVFVMCPSIEITKTGPDFSAPGHLMEYSIIVTNTGNVMISEYEIWDYAEYQDPAFGYGVDLAPGDSHQWYYYITVPEDFCQVDADGFYYNFIEVIGDVFGDEHCIVYDSYEIWTEIVCPSMEVTKTKLGDFDFSAPGHVIEWEIAVENTGNVPLMSVDIEDPLTGDYWYDVFIDVGQTWSTVVEYMVPEDWCVECGECTHVINVVFVTADVFGDEHCILMDQAENAVFIHCPSIEIFKTALVDYSAPGHVIPYEIAVHNNGNVPIAVFDVLDYLTGAYWVDVDLQVDEWRYYYTEYLVPEDYCEINPECVVHNYADSYADVYGDGHCWLYAWAEEWVTIHCPSFEVTKTKLGDFDFSAPGHVIEWEIVVTNTGNIPLVDVTIWDPLVDLLVEDIYLDVGESWSMVVEYMVPEDWCETCGECTHVINVVFVTVDVYGDEHCILEDQAENAVFIHCPSFEVTKTKLGDFDFSAAGHIIEWEIVVTNTGNIPLVDVTIWDPLVDLLLEDIYLDVGESWSMVVEYMVPENWCEVCAGECTHVINVVFVTVDVYGDGHCILEDQAESAVFIHCPSIEVFKTGQAFTAPGHEVTWEISVHNNGNIPLDTVYIYEVAYSPISGMIVGETYIVLYDMQPCEWYNFTVTYVVPEMWDCSIDGSWIWNDVWVDADVYGDGHCWVSDYAIWDVFVHCPSVDIIKIPLVEFSAPGHLIQWEIVVTNTGNIPLGFLDVVDYLTGDHVYIYNLGVGESVSFIVEYEVPLDYCECGDCWVYNFVDVIVDVYNDTHCWLYDCAESSVFIHCPSMEVAKTALDDYSAAGHVTTWLIEVWNTGNIPLEQVTVDDPMAGFFATDIYLPVGGYWSQVVEIVVPEDWCFIEDGDFLCNWVFVTADVYGDEHCILEGYAEDCVFIICPCITVEKIGPPEVCWGHEVVWEIIVTNCGNVPLECIFVSDPLTGFETIIPILQPGETIVLYTSYMVPYGFCETDWLFNEVFVWTWLFGDHCELTAYDYSEVFIAKPVIDLQKTGPEFAVRGETITYTLTVHNDGNVPLMDVWVYDEYLDWGVYIPYLEVGETLVFEVPFTIPPCWECEHFTNWAKVEAYYYGWDCICFVEDSNCHEVTILEQEITVLKTGPEMAEPGDTITFVITVTNTGEVPLTDVFVWDPMLEMEWFVGDLGIGESWEIMVDYTIPFCYEGDGLCNFAFASGWYHGVMVESGDGWAVYIFHDPCADPDPTPNEPGAPAGVKVA